MTYTALVVDKVLRDFDTGFAECALRFCCCRLIRWPDPVVAVTPIRFLGGVRRRWHVGKSALKPGEHSKIQGSGRHEGWQANARHAGGRCD